ncbi:hypothetical protein BGZ99_010018 [Dissophora globulifera]|uniref:Uncharacterized protein n=1 Tax=Dissophora globulifera TaxID=979702 RepID=A0A9P6RWV5_9FUNG|nr:hypothetical protein BGZ99_010018 [Dissophora globulifera]
MSDVKHNAMGKPGPVNEDCLKVFEDVKDNVLKEIHRLNREDDRHGLHEMDKPYKPVLFATEEVSFGTNYFAKIHLGDEKYVHARAHKNHHGKVDFYMLHTTPECAVWEKDTPLVYFND